MEGLTGLQRYQNHGLSLLLVFGFYVICVLFFHVFYWIIGKIILGSCNHSLDENPWPNSSVTSVNYM